MKIKALTRVQKFIRENNVPVFNMAEYLQSSHNHVGGIIVVQPKEDLRITFSDAICSDGERVLGMTWHNPMNNGEDAQWQKCKTQKEMIEKYMELAGVEEKEEVEVVVEKSAVAPLESPVKITPESTAMNVSRESESARKVAELANQHNAGYWTKILDYGCGLGRNINYLIRNTESICIDGCDTPEQIENLRKDAEKMRFFKKSGSIIATSDRVRHDYDFILNSHVLNVVMDDVKKIIIEDMYELLKEGGKAVIQVRTESDVASAKTKEKYGDGWLIKKGKDTTYQEGITKEKMQELLTDAGFKIINHRFTKSIHMVEVVK